MSATSNEQAGSRQDDFAKGRKEVFDFIRDHLSFNTNRHAAGVMKDVFGADTMVGDAFDMNDMIQSSSHALYGEIENMLHVLAAGEDVYTLTGQNKIPGYKQITGGDINAGRLSAAQDFSIMLLSVDVDHVSRPHAQRYMKKREVFVMPENVKIALGHSNSRVLEDIYDGVQRDIVNKLPQAELIGYEGTAPAPPRMSALGSTFNALARKTKMMNGFAGRYASVPNAWPPFKIDPGMQAVHAQKAVPQITAPPGFADIANDTPEFAAAQRDYLKTVYVALQDAHFEAANNTHDYAKRTGLPATWEKQVVEVANDLFFDLRTALAERMNNGAVGAGATTQDGIKAGQDWLKSELAKIDIPARYKGSSNRQVAAEHLAVFWLKTAEDHAPAQAQAKKVLKSKTAVPRVKRKTAASQP